MVGFRGSTQEKWPSEIFRFGYRKAASDKKVPDPVGSGFFVLQKVDHLLGDHRLSTTVSRYCGPVTD